ncbi:STAS domain-containing protein [Hyphobacterium sp. SN044]|uniref:STAS domain-containing protein n=1 Tax=Hyphobacterium sp. SN044 TaxID=2912575 RepID=UPI001F2F96EF|nr:STAS domain-containing protein [Hyphobacterium sp. SN044]MCF8880099.1 STAS domain-containing protein [Hyphobacterium sp. SN044]
MADIYLPARLDLQSAASLKTALSAAGRQPVRLDASGVEWVGGLGFQLLAAAAEKWRAEGQLMRVDTPSEAFLRGVARLGGLDLPTAMAGDEA